MTTKEKFLKPISIVMVFVVSFCMFTTNAFAGSYTARSLAVSNANPSATGVTYTFTFTVSNTSTTYNHVMITYSVNSDGTGGVPAGLNPGTAGSTTLAGTTPSFTWTTPSTKLSWVTGAAQTAGSKTITLTNVTNPSTTAVFYASIKSYSSVDESALIDEGDVATATVPVVTVTGTQLESLTASVAGLTTGTVCTGSTVVGTTTATAINFGNFTGLTSISAAQRLTLGSNATNGVTAKLVENQLLTSAGTTIADFGTTTDISAGTAWSAGSSTGFGVCAAGGDANATNFGSANLYKSLITTPKTVANTTAPSNNTNTDIEFRVAVPVLQRAGVYTNQLTYNILANY